MGDAVDFLGEGLSFVGDVFESGFKESTRLGKKLFSPAGMTGAVIGYGMGGPLGAYIGMEAGSSLAKGMQMPAISMPGAPTALSDDAKEADKAASEAARKKALEERKRRALLGRESTFTGSEKGLLEKAPLKKKTLLGQ